MAAGTDLTSSPSRTDGCASIARRKVIYDLYDVGLIDRRTVDFYHLRNFGLPEVSLEFRALWLGLNVVSRVTGGATLGPGLKGAAVSSGCLSRDRVGAGGRLKSRGYDDEH